MISEREMIFFGIYIPLGPHDTKISLHNQKYILLVMQKKTICVVFFLKTISDTYLQYKYIFKKSINSQDTKKLHDYMKNSKFSQKDFIIMHRITKMLILSHLTCS